MLPLMIKINIKNNKNRRFGIWLPLFILWLIIIPLLILAAPLVLFDSPDCLAEWMGKDST